MLAFMRRVFIGSWLGRILAVVIFASFAVWGIGDFFTNLIGGGGANVATIAGRHITTDEFERTYQRALGQTAQSQGNADPTSLPVGERRQIAIQAMQQLIFQAVIANQAGRTGIVVPDQIVRDQIFAEKAFVGADGKFSRALFDQRMQAAGFTEDQLVKIFREQSAATALIEPIRVGASAPSELVRRAFDYGAETRVLDMVALPFAAVPAPQAPDDAALHRYFDNNKDRFKAPEYRRIKVVLLSPETIAHGLDIPEADERRAYDTLITKYQVPEKRSVQVLIVPDENRARQLAGLWTGGVAWTQLQATAKDATPISLDDATLASIPSPDIARLVFAAQTGAVTGPAKTDAGWVVVRVSKITPPVNRTFEQAKNELHDMVGQQQAAALLSPRVQKLQDAIAGGGLDAIPGDLGAVAAEGTLDMQGLTSTGDPAPFPGSDAIRKAILAQAFAARKGDVPTLMQGPESSWYALAVEDVTPAKPLTFEQAGDRLRADWQQDAVRHVDEQSAAALYAEAQAHGGLAVSAATRPGLLRDLAVRRGQTAGPVPPNLVQIAFSLKPGTSTMLETPTGFVVATITAIHHPGPSVDTLAYSRTRQALDASLADDIENSYVSTLRDRAKPNINVKAVEKVVGVSSGAGASNSSSGS
ncbi:MAG: peptidyl-prolyl cis-trans isomerase [Janthinobacterium lividum]